MQKPISLYIASRYARSSQNGKFIGFISLFSTLGIALGVTALIIVVSVMDGFETILKQRMLGAVPHISVYLEEESDANNKQKITKDNQTLLTDVEQTLNRLALQQQVIQTLPLVQTQAIVQMPNDLKGVLLHGVSSFEQIPVAVQEFLVQGEWQQLLTQKYGLVIGRYMAMEYGLAVGDEVRVLISGASHYTPLGRMPAQRKFTITGIFETQSEVDQQLMLTRSTDLNRLLRRPADQYDGVRLVLKDPFDAPKISQDLAQLLTRDSYHIENWHKTHGKLFDAVKMEKNMMWFMLSLIIAVAAFNIVSSLVMMVTKKQGEIAILKTQGMTGKTIARIFTLQGAYNGVLGALIGGTLGILITSNINTLTSMTGVNLLGVPGVGLPIDLNLTKVSIILLFAMLLALLASIYPARKAASLKPADVLRYE